MKMVCGSTMLSSFFHNLYIWIELGGFWNWRMEEGLIRGYWRKTIKKGSAGLYKDQTKERKKGRMKGEMKCRFFLILNFESLRINGINETLKTIVWMLEWSILNNLINNQCYCINSIQ